MFHRTSLLGVLGMMLLASFAIGAPDAPASRPASQPIKQAEDGTILLHAKDVTIHGTTVRYEPKPEKNTIGFWTKKEDWVSWDLVVAKGGRFEVTILQGCGKGSGGAEVEFIVGEKKLKTVVEDTGGFQNFVSRAIGTFELPAGTYTLSVKPLTKPGVAVMDLRSVTLKPAEKK
jgi:arylsulfatase A